jgi:hypothetical protein
MTYAQKPGLARAWGDGVGDARPHVIENMEWSNGLIECRCGGIVTTSEFVRLDAAWANHRGINTTGPSVEETRLASDSEVNDFLHSLDESTHSPLRGNSWGVTATAPTVEELDELLTRVRVLGERCTCTRRSDITQCPNYVEGEDD